MHRDLLDLLQCPRPHDPSWLVAVVTRANGAELIEAALACPLCGAEFAIASGVAHFGATAVDDPERERSNDPNRTPAPAHAVHGASADDLPDAERVAALLGDLRGGYPILLTGRYARVGAKLGSLIDVPQVWLEAPSDTATPSALDALPHSRLTGAPALPFGANVLAGAAIDPQHASDALLSRVVGALRHQARLLTSAAVPVPASLTLLARDALEWVAQANATAGGLVALHRRPPAPG
jgi:uncharacterized protein YbaR (Trm112 family)